MNLLMAPLKQKLEIIKIRSSKLDEKQEKFLANLGFREGSIISVVSSCDGNVILNIKDSRVAMGKEISEKILVKIL